jgi:hypothetical protein
MPAIAMVRLRAAAKARRHGEDPFRLDPAVAARMGVAAYEPAAAPSRDQTMEHHAVGQGDQRHVAAARRSQGEAHPVASAQGGTHGDPARHHLEIPRSQRALQQRHLFGLGQLPCQIARGCHGGWRS